MNKSAIFTSNGIFPVPLDVSFVKLTMIAASGAGSARGGGGAGQFCINVPFPVTPGSDLAIFVGTKGIAMLPPGDIYYGSTDGGDSYVGNIRVERGYAPYAQGGNPTVPRSGRGGGVNGGDAVGFNDPGLLAPRSVGQPLLAINRGQSCICFWSGGSGAGAPGGGNPSGSFGAAAVNINVGGENGGTWPGPDPPYSDGGGASSPFGRGARGGGYYAYPTSLVGQDVSLSHYGAGGGGGSSDHHGGNGAGGKVIVSCISNL